MLKKALLLLSGNAVGSALSLMRNLIIARLVSPHDFGIASTFALAMSIVEMLSYVGLNQLIVVDRDGDAPELQRSMQGFQVLRGIVSSVILFLIAGPYARFLGIGEVTWAYQLMAVIPLVNGLQHFDMHRLKRHMNFRPWVISQSIPPLVSVLLLWPLAVTFGDYRIMLAALIIQAVTMVTLSHLTAERPYRLRFDPELIRRATAFGWPILLNGVLLFGVFNGERLIVGRELGMSQLAVFSMAITLTLTPTLVLAGTSQNLFLSPLSSARDKPETFRWLGIAATEFGIAIGVALVLGTVLVGGPLVHLLLGAKYEALLAILVPMAVLQAVRTAKTGASTVALARERTGNSAWSNLFRVLSLPISWYLVSHSASMLTVIWVGTLAEVLGFLMAMRLAAGRSGLALGPLVLPSFLSALACGAALVVDHFDPPRTGLVEHIADPLRWLVAAFCLAALMSMSALRGYAFRRLGR